MSRSANISSRTNRTIIRLLYLLSSIFYLLCAHSAHAARIGDISETTLWDQALRFFTFQDPSVRYALLGSMLLGISCGLLGSFLVVRKMALVGDALSHAVLPGVALGFLWNMSKDPVAIFIGATLAGLLGAGAVHLIKQTTRLKEDTALGLVLASFFAVGICMVTMIQRLPTGPFMVLAATAVFGMAFFFGPRHGIVARWWRQRSRSARTQRENTLKSIYQVLEGREFQGEGASLRELAERRRETLEEVAQQAAALRAHGLATLHDDGNHVFLTPEGWQRAFAIVRNHRLWELYLTHEARLAADHVHEDAEKIEHVLGEETVRELERRLAFAKTDPHGRAIPGLADAQRGTAPGPRDDLVGFGKRP